jgi:DNA-binding response OmpR family regulator
MALGALRGPARQLKTHPPVTSTGSLLVIDDEPAVVDVLRDFFEGHGYTVNCALSGREALVLASLSRPDAVILDIRMPERDGPEVLRDLLALDDSITVVMLSGTDDEELARELLKAGAFDYLRKPFQLDNLGQVVDVAVLLGRRKTLPDDGAPWPCDSRALAETTPAADIESECGHCQQRVYGGDTTAVRERGSLYHASCWLSRFTEKTSLQLARS